MSDDYIYDDINLTKRKTITNGEKYDFFIYKMLSLEKKLSNGEFGKGDTVISQIKNYRLQDDEGEEMLEVKLKCSKKIDDAMDGFDPAKKFNGDLVKCFKKIKARLLIASFNSDWLFPKEYSMEIQIAAIKAEIKSSYIELEGDYGHDSFLYYSDEYSTALKSFLENNE